VELKHIAVKSGWRNHGIGKEMIYEYLLKNGIKKMFAETDKDAVYFYERIGFEIMSLGEKYPGVERFKCTL
jgi:ribosomal protein S18 acetylase RimI-like enzyme